MIGCGASSNPLNYPDKIDPNVAAFADRIGSSWQFNFKLDTDILYPAGYFPYGSEYSWSFQFDFKDGNQERPLSLRFLSNSFPIAKEYTLEEIISNGDVGIYEKIQIGDTYQWKLLENSTVAITSQGFYFNTNNSSEFNRLLKNSSLNFFNSYSGGNLLVSKNASCPLESGDCTLNFNFHPSENQNLKALK